MHKIYSAGSQPRGEVHPMAIELLQERGYDTADLRSKNRDEFAKTRRPQPRRIGVWKIRPLSWAPRTSSDRHFAGSTHSSRSGSSSSPVFA